MKKLLAIFLCLCVLFSLAACGQTEEERLASEQQAYNEFIANSEAESVQALNARIIADANGDKMITADIKNSGTDAISEVILCFAIWDANGVPMTIKSARNPENTIYEFQMNVTEVTVAAGETWSESKGIYLAEECGEIGFAKAVVVSYKTGDTVYENPHYDTWKETYLEKNLQDWMK